MIRKISLLLISILATSLCFAQGDQYGWTRDQFNLGFSTTTLTVTDMPALKSNFSGSLSVSRTFYLHRPIGKFLRFGIDATWFDLNYTNYKIKHITHSETNNYQYHQGELAVQVGPSITLKPVGKFHIHGYFKYAPALSTLFTDKGTYYAYAPYFVGGATISVGAVGVGLESRLVECNYAPFRADGKESAMDDIKSSYVGWRVYLTFRF